MTVSALDLLTSWFAPLKPRARILPSTFAEASIVLPPSSNSRPGRLELTALQRGMIDAAAEEGVREIVMMLGTQIGKTIVLNGLLMWSALGDAGPMLLIRPTDGEARSFIRENLDPMIQASPALNRTIGAGPKGLNGIGFKSFLSGSLAIGSSYNAAALAARAIRVLLCDEIDRFCPNLRGEGEPVAIARRRTSTFSHNSLTVLASTPTHVSTSRIAANHARGDQRVFKVKCRACGQAGDLTVDRLKFEPGRPETARLLCLECGHRATEDERIRMLEDGVWVPTAEGEPGVVSFQAGEIASEFSTLAEIAHTVEKAVTPEARRVLMNTVWGLPYESEAEVEVDPRDLQSRAIPISTPYSGDIDFITAGVDVQKERVEVTFAGFSEKEVTVLDHVKIFGDPTGSRLWADLDELLGRAFLLSDRRRIHLSAVFIDSGFEQGPVVEFVIEQRRKLRKTWPIKGMRGFGIPPLVLGKKIRSRVAPFNLGVSGLKLNILRALAPKQDDVRPIRLPDHLGPDYFVQLTAERLVTHWVKGFAKYAWVNKRRARNEAIDCLTYASAAALTVTERAQTIGDVKVEPTLGERMIALNNRNK